jgi:hypothetical protein
VCSLGLDVGKGEYHAIGLDPAGKQLPNAALPDSEPTLREVFDKLAKHGRILVVVDQSATIGALPATSWSVPAAMRWPTYPATPRPTPATPT